LKALFEASVAGRENANGNLSGLMHYVSTRGILESATFK
jgi:hypothetical protein